MKVHWPFNNHFLIRCCPSRPQFLIVSDSHKHLYSPLISYSHCFLSKLPPRRGRGLSGRHSCMDAWKALPLTPADLQSSHGCAASGICLIRKGPCAFPFWNPFTAWGSKVGRNIKNGFGAQHNGARLAPKGLGLGPTLGIPKSIGLPKPIIAFAGAVSYAADAVIREKTITHKIWAETYVTSC